MVHIIIFGAPGSGKGTLSGQIKEILPDIIHISTGDIFRENFKNKTPLGLQAKEYIDKGALVPDNLTNEIIKDKLIEIENDSWILDGYPRNLTQVQFLSEITKVDLFLLLSVKRDIIIKRISGRYGCKKCGKIYNKFTIFPKVEGICDKCGAEIKFEQRNDDNEETLKNRLDTYEKHAKPIIEFYQNEGKLKEIDATNTLDYSDEDIKSFIEL